MMKRRWRTKERLKTLMALGFGFLCQASSPTVAATFSNEEIASRFSNADPFGLGRLLLQKKQLYVQSPSTMDIDTLFQNIQSICQQSKPFSHTLGTLNKGVDQLKGMSCQKEFEMKYQMLHKALDCLEKRHLTEENDLQDLFQRLNTLQKPKSQGGPSQNQPPLTGLPPLLQSIAQKIANDNPQLVRLGGAPQDWVEYYQEAAQTIQSLEVQDKITLLKHLLDQAEASKLDGPIYSNKQQVIKIIETCFSPNQT